MKSLFKLFLLGTFYSSIGGVQAAEKPNFIIIFTDDQGYQDLGCYGSPDIKTPNIDQMAKEGMKFTSFYAQTVCGPSRGALLTGCYPLRFARQADPNSIHPELHLEEVTIAEVLKEQGYATGVIGKWDLAGHNPASYKKELLPAHQGFDYFFGTSGSNDSVVNLIRGTEKIESKADMATLTKRYTDEAISFIERSKDKPFFLYLAHTMPHTKLAASGDFKGKSEAGLYGDVIEELDFNVGRVLSKVKDLGLDENTYVVFTSDNGPWLIRKDHGGHAKPLRSGKTSWWEGGLRVPCIIRAPGRVPAGTVSGAITATIDMMPTIAKLAGVEAPSDRVIDGVDISAVMHGELEEVERNYFYYQHDCLRAVRAGYWKLVLAHTEPEMAGIRNTWKQHISKVDSARITEAQLYDLNADIGEAHDVAKQHPDKVAELMKLAEWAKTDLGDHDVFGKNARTFGAQRRTLSTEDGYNTKGKKKAASKKGKLK
ncbi:MAG: sulfatase family protein [Akkermansiaceae bacterium]